MINQRGSIPAILVIGIILAVAAVGGGTYIFTHGLSPQKPTTTTTAPAPTATPVSDSSGASLGSITAPQSTSQPISLDFLSQAKLSEQNIKNSPKLLATEKLADGSTQYSLKSFLLARPDLTIYKDGQVVFQKTVSVTTNLVHPKLSTYLAKLGTPDKILTGSKYYGPFEKIYVFATKGVTLTANSNTDEVDEVSTYLPSNVDDYLKNWGGDYQPGPDTISDNF